MAPFANQIFVNLPVSDIKAAHAFYAAIGMTLNPTYSDPTTSAMTISPHITVMIMTHERFKSFMPPNKDLVCGRNGTEVLLCIGVEKKEDVDAILEKAEMAGGKKDPTKLPEMEGMYGRSFEDLEGHVWEVMWMGGACEGVECKGEQKE